MEEMIKRIIDMDKKAREITDAAQQEKIDCEKEIAQKDAQLRSEWRRQKAKYDKQREDLEASYGAHHEEWVKQIVANVLSD